MAQDARVFLIKGNVMGKSQRDSGDKSPSVRSLRVNENVRHAVSTIITRGEIHDPVLADVPITVSEVRVSTDMRNAIVYIMPLGGENQDEIIKSLNKAAPFIRGQLSKRVKMKYMPALDFRIDQSFDEASHIEKLLAHPKVQRDVIQEDDE